MRKHVYANDILTAEITIDKYFPTALRNDVIVLPPPIAATQVETQTWNITVKRWVANDARKNVADNDFKRGWRNNQPMYDQIKKRTYTKILTTL